MSRFFLVLLLLPYCSSSQNPDSIRSELTGLMKKRAELFQEYSESLSKKSGLFGNRTKNDLRQSHDQLKAIVEQDNKIMAVLQRTVQYKTFEKTTMNYDVNEFAERIRNLNIINDTLQKQLQVLQTEIKEVKKEKRNRGYAMAGLLAVLILLLFRKKRVARLGE